MNQEQFVTAMTRISLYFKNFELTIEQIAAWYPFFKNIDEETFHLAIDHYVVTNEYDPNVKRLIDAIEVVSQKRSKDVEDVWQHVRYCVRTYSLSFNPDKFYKELNDYDPLAVKTVKTLEYEIATMSTDNMDDIRRRFQRYYLSELKRIQHDKKIAMITGSNQQLLT